MSAFLTDIKATLAEIEADGLYKRERAISTPQSTHITAEGRPMLNLCANNYLGLADHPALIKAATQAMQEHGYGMASRFSKSPCPRSAPKTCSSKSTRQASAEPICTSGIGMTGHNAQCQRRL